MLGVELGKSMVYNLFPRLSFRRLINYRGTLGKRLAMNLATFLLFEST